MPQSRACNRLRAARPRPALAPWSAIAVLATTLSVSGHRVDFGALTAVAPSGASPGVTIAITGTGFDPTASSNEVAFVPAAGPPLTARGSAIALISAASGTRRLSVPVPAGLAFGRAALRVTNLTTGEISEGAAIDVVGISLPGTASAARGATALAVRITGTANTRFVAGSSRAAFGAGITVHSTTVESATSLVASISIASSSPLGPRTVSVVSPAQTAAAAGAFTVADTNRAPRITSTPVTTAREQLAYHYQVQAADDDHDALSYVLTTAPAGMTVDGSGLISWTPGANPPASVDVVLVVSDPSTATDTQAFQIAVARAPAVNRAPRITSTPALDGAVSQPYTYDVDAEDADTGDTLTFGLIQPPAGMTIDAASGIVAWTPAPTQSGPFAVTVRVSDGTDAVQQAFELTIAGPQNTNRPPAAHAGGPYKGEADAAIAFDGTLSTDPDGDPLTFSWNFGDGTGPASGSAPAHVYAEAGSFTATLTVSDGRGGESARSTTVAVGAAGDRAPPSISILGPRDVLPGDQITLTALVTDNVAVENVTFTVGGGPPTETSTAPFERTVVVPAVAAPGTEIHVVAVARDPSGNAGTAEATLTIRARPDTEKPTIALNLPALAAPGTTIHVSASAADNSGVQSVGFAVEGASLATVTEPPFEASYAIPAGTPVGASLTLSAFALDFNGNRGDATGTVAIVQTADTQPPTVELSARAQVVPGSALPLTAIAADNRGVSSVDFYVDGVRIATDTQVPYAASFVVPSATPPGGALHLEARATDFSGLEGTDARQAQIVAAATLTQGIVAGEVYDDATGLPVEGADITLSGTDSTSQPYTQTATTDARGRYVLRAAEGRGVVHVSRPGWTHVDRPVDIVPDRAVNVLDARLTAVSVASAPVNPVLGATIAGPQQAALVIPAGGLQATASFSLTPIGQQGLQGQLPAGWSPVAAADIAPRSAVLAAPASLTLPRPEGIPAGRALVLLEWDEPAGAWRAIGTSDSGPPGALTFAIQRPGQYVWVVGDAAPAAPPAAVVGAALQGAAAAPLPIDASTTVLPRSTIVFYQPGVRTDVTGQVTVPSPATSGAVVFTRVSESYRFTSGLEAHLEPSAQDLVLYQYGGGVSPAGLSARYAVTPALTFEPATLESGVITVELFEAAAGSHEAALIGNGGGAVAAPSGERADIPSNGLTFPGAIDVRAVGPADTGIVLPPALAFVGGLHLTAPGTQFTSPVTISIPRPPQVAPADQILVARLAEVGGATRLLLVAVGRSVGDRIESSTTLGDNLAALEGARVEGRYLFLRPASPVGFAAGSVRAVNGDPFAGALVSANTLPLFALSRVDGAYVAAAATGALTLLARDVLRNDTGSAQGHIGAASVLPLDVRLSVNPPAVVSITPADQAVNVPLSSPIVVTFSEPLNPASVTASSVVLAGPDGAPVSATLSLSGGNTVVTLRPAAALEADTAYTLAIAATIADLSGYTLPQAITARFVSLDVTAPPPPAAGAVTASIPGADGLSTITATQGTAHPRDTVAVVNVTRGTATPVLLDPSGGFTVIVPAALSDQLRLRIVDTAGNETIVAMPRFSRLNANGSLSVAIDAQGGRIEGPGGVAMTIRPGTFPDGAVVTIKPVAEAEFPVPLTAEHREVYAFAGGVELDFGGKVPTQYVDVSVPAGPDDRVENQWIVAQVKQLNGQNVLHVVDTAKLIGGKVTTSSPPCPGVNAAAVYGIYKSNRLLGLTFGSLLTDDALVVRADLLVDHYIDPFLFSPDAFPPLQTPMCLPVLSGRVTVAPNTVTISVPQPNLGRALDRVTVTNVTRNGTKTHFPRRSLELPVTVAGNASDKFEVRVASGNDYNFVTFKQTPGLPGFVELALPVNPLTLAADEVIVTNVSAAPAPDTIVPAETLRVKLRVAGGVSDTYAVHVTDQSLGVTAPAMFGVFSSNLGAGNLVARAAAGTIDPTQAEIDAYNAAHPDAPLSRPARTRVEIVSASRDNPSVPVSVVEIPDGAIIHGGFNFAFDGDTSLLLSVRVSYANGSTDSILVPVFRITVTDPAGELVKTIVLPSPPPDEPLNLGPLSNDHDPPGFSGDLTFLEAFDPSDILTFTFSEPMDAESVKANFVVTDQSGTQVFGEVRVSDGNTTVTFVPDAPLALGAKYFVSFVDITDRGGNPLPVDRLLFSTVAPRLMGSFATTPGDAGVREIQVRAKDAGDIPSVFLAVTTNTKLGHPLLMLDVTDPAKPMQAGSALAGYHKRHVTLVPDITALRLSGPSRCRPSELSFTGDLAVTSSYTADFIYVSFFDVTDAKAPCLIGNKLLTAAPESELFPETQRNTYHLSGLAASGVATIRHADGIAVYTAILEGGLFVTDVGSNIPEQPGSQRVKEPMLPGSYFDVAARGGQLLALNRASWQLELLDPSLAVLNTLPLTDGPRRIVFAEGFPFDADRDGTLESGEFVDAAFIAGDRSIVMVDVTNPQALRIVGRIPMPAAIRAVDVDRQRRRLVAIDVRDWVYLLDASRMATASLLDYNLDGIDDRISWSRKLAAEGDAVRFDPDRPFFYVGTARGIDVYGFGPPNLSGTATYTHIPPHTGAECHAPVSPKCGLNYGGSFPRPIRGAIVELQNATGALLQTTTTNDSGYYSFDAPPGEVEVVIKAALGTPNDIHVDVVDNTSANKVHEKRSGKFVVGLSTTKDLYAETFWTPDFDGLYLRRTGAPFAILDAIYVAEKVIRSADPEIKFPMLHVAWSSMNEPSTYGDGSISYENGIIGTAAHWNEAHGTIYLHGKAHFDTDEYDTQVVLHEWTHYFQDALSRNDEVNGGNAHGPGEWLDPRTAFGEGFATAHAAMLSGDAEYIDTNGRDQGTTNLYQNLEQNSSPEGGFYLEDSISEVLWDLFDGDDAAPLPSPTVPVPGPTRDDDLELGYKPIYLTMRGGFRTTPAFTSIFAFLHHLRQRYLTNPSEHHVAAEIATIAHKEGIDAARADEYDMEWWRMYTAVPVDGTRVTTFDQPSPLAGPLTTSTGRDPRLEGNKLFSYVFFKFTVAVAGTYEVEVAPNDIIFQDLKTLHLEVNRDRNGKTVNANAADGGDTVTLSLDLAPGDYTAAVRARAWDSTDGVWRPGNAQFTIRITPQ